MLDISLAKKKTIETVHSYVKQLCREIQAKDRPLPGSAKSYRHGIPPMVVATTLHS